MKYNGILLGLLIGASGIVSGQVRPDQFPEETNPDNSNFEVYSQKNGLPRRASLYNLKRYYVPDIELTPVNYIPSTSGNMNNRMMYVIDPNDEIWYIDADGDALKLTGDGTIYARQTVAHFSGNQFVIPADAINLKVYIGGLLQEEGADYNRSGSIINFTWTPPGIRLTVIYRQ